MPRIRQAGQLNRRIKILRASESPSAFNEPVPTWGEAGEVWASREDLDGSESVRSAEVAASATVRFCVKHSPFTVGINPRDRVLYGGVVHEIVAVREQSRNAYREIDAVARAELPPAEAP